MTEDDEAGDIVLAMCAAWEVGDVETALSYLADDAVFTLHLEASVADHAGPWVGRAAIRKALVKARRMFDYQLYRPSIVGGREDGTFHVNIDLVAVHRATGERWSTRFRQVIRVEDGFVTQVDEYHDAEMVKAFLRFAEASAREPKPPS